MASWMPDTEKERELLSQAIVKTLDSWPEIYRRIFSEVHYGGKSVESVAAAVSMRPAEVYALLEDCERNLRQALKAFRPRTAAGITMPVPQYADRCA